MACNLVKSTIPQKPTSSFSFPIMDQPTACVNNGAMMIVHRIPSRPISKAGSGLSRLNPPFLLFLYFSFSYLGDFFVIAENVIWCISFHHGAIKYSCCALRCGGQRSGL